MQERSLPTMWDFWLHLMQLVLCFYYFITIPFRLAFRYHVIYSSQFWYILLLDYLTDAIFIVHFVASNSKVVAAFIMTVSGKVAPVEEEKSLELASVPRSPGPVDVKVTENDSKSLPGNSELNGANKPDVGTAIKAEELEYKKIAITKHNISETKAFMDMLQAIEEVRKRRATPIGAFLYKLEQLRDQIPLILDLISVLPFELLGYASGMGRYYTILRVFRLIRLWRSWGYWCQIIDVLDGFKVLTAASAKRVLLLTVIMIILSHIGACTIMAIASSQLDYSPPVRDLWITFDGIVVFDEDCGHPKCDTFTYTKPLYYIYIRAFYWAVVTCVSGVLCRVLVNVWCVVVNV